MNILAIYLSAILPLHCVDELQFFPRDGNAIISKNCSCSRSLISDIKPKFAFENFENFVRWNNKFRKSQVLLNKVVVMVTPDILGTKGIF